MKVELLKNKRTNRINIGDMIITKYVSEDNLTIYYHYLVVGVEDDNNNVTQKTLVLIGNDEDVTPCIISSDYADYDSDMYSYCESYIDLNDEELVEIIPGNELKITRI